MEERREKREEGQGKKKFNYLFGRVALVDRANIDSV